MNDSSDHEGLELLIDRAESQMEVVEPGTDMGPLRGASVRASTWSNSDLERIATITLVGSPTLITCS